MRPPPLQQLQQPNAPSVQPVFRGRELSCNETLTLHDGHETVIPCTLSDLQFLETIGQGAFGRVFKAVHKDTGTVMSIKTYVMETASMSTMLREVEILCQSRCHEIIGYFGAFYHECEISICMEYMDCGSLDHIYKHCLASQPAPLPPWLLSYVARAVVRGLKYLQDHNILHRDIKPSNMLMNTGGEIKLCDFNVAGIQSGTHNKTFVGTSFYMAPERLQGHKYNHLADIWSLGISLVELALGRIPYNLPPKSTPFHVVMAVVRSPPPELKASDGFSASLCDFVAQCLRHCTESTTIEDHARIGQPHQNNAPRPQPQALLQHELLRGLPDNTHQVTEWVRTMNLKDKFPWRSR